MCHGYCNVIIYPMTTPDISRIIRSRRRTLAVQVERDGSVTLRAPLRASDRAIRSFVWEHAEWIARRQQKARERLESWPPRRFVEGEAFLYLGSAYPLHIDGSASVPLTFDNTRFVLAAAHAGGARQAFERWYRDQAAGIISEAAEHYAKRSGLEYARVKITGARKRWGSCSAGGNLCFTWRLAMAPLEAVDYVAAHELAHIRHRDHSAAFWAEVERMLPDYKMRRKWLRENEYRLTL